MIYCVAFGDLVSYLHDLGFVEAANTDAVAIFTRGTDLFTVRQPNVDGHVPEMIVTDALDMAALPVPPFDVFWCD